MSTHASKRDPKPQKPGFWRTFGLAIAGAALPLIGAPVAYDNLSSLLAVARSTEPAVGFDFAIVIGAFVGSIMTVAGVLLTIWDQKRSYAAARELERNRAHSVTRFTDELGSTLDVLVDFADSDGQREESDKLIKNVLREGRRLYAHPGVRLCLYMLEETEQEEEQLRQQHLQLRAYDGRRDSPRSEFVEGEHSNSLIWIANGNRSVSVPDPASPPVGIAVDHTEHSGWSSYLAVPVISGRAHVGVLLVDTRDRTDFTHEDKSIGWTIARLLAHGLQASERKALDVGAGTFNLLDAFNAQRQSSALSEERENLSEEHDSPLDEEQGEAGQEERGDQDG